MRGNYHPPHALLWRGGGVGGGSWDNEWENSDREYSDRGHDDPRLDSKPVRIPAKGRFRKEAWRSKRSCSDYTCFLSREFSGDHLLSSVQELLDAGPVITGVPREGKRRILQIRGVLDQRLKSLISRLTADDSGEAVMERSDPANETKVADK